MYVKRPNMPVAVRLPDGTLLSRSDLPPKDTVRWVASRKMIVVMAVASGLVTRDEVQTRYQLSGEELNEWESASQRNGLNGLKATVRAGA